MKASRARSSASAAADGVSLARSSRTSGEARGMVTLPVLSVALEKQLELST